MSAHVHFDEAEVEARAEKMSASSAAKMEAPGSEGAQARFNHAIMKHFYVAIAREANRGTAGEHVLDVLDAVAAILANITRSYALTVTTEDMPFELRCVAVNNLMLRFGEFLEHALSERLAPTDVVKPMQGGRA